MTLRVSPGVFLSILFAVPFVARATSHIISNTEAIRQAQSLQAQSKAEGNTEMAAKFGEMLKNLTKPLVDGNAMCNPVTPVCKCGQVMGKNGCEKGANMYMCPCFQTVPTGMATGQCVAPNNCKGQGFSDQAGKTQSVGDSKGFMDALKGVMDLLKQAMQGQQQQQQQPQTGTQGCTTYRQVSTPTTDPCAYYVPPTSSSLLTNTGLTDATSGSGTNVS